MESLSWGIRLLNLERDLKATRRPLFIKNLEIFWEMPSTKGMEARKEGRFKDGVGLELERKKDLAWRRALEICLHEYPFKEKTYQR